MSYDLLFQKAVELQNNGALNEAQEIYLKMLEAMPYNSDVWNLLGLIAQTRGDNLKGIDCFLAAIKYSPKPFAPYFFNLAISYKALGKKNDAIENYEKALKIMPELKEGWNYLGVLQAEIGDITDAVKSFCKALDLDDNYKEARANLCYYTKDKKRLLELADNDENDFMANFLASKLVDDEMQKIKYLTNATNIEPYRVDVLLEFAKVYWDNDDKEKSLIYYHKVLNLDENNIEAILGAADIYLWKRNFEKAEHFYNKSFAIKRDIAGAYVNYGALLFEQKRYTEALNSYREAVRLEPENSEISYNLALILKDVDDYTEALGLMFNAYLKDKCNERFQIGIMETISELFEKNAELALKIAQNWQNMDKDNVFSKRLLSALSGADLINDDVLYAKKLFDEFAENYDETMNKLDCNIINKFCELNPNLEGRVLELGVGSGNAAKLLKNEKVVFDGVDVSEKMIELAEKTNRYDNLYCEDIESFISKNDLKKYDKVVSFDVFCYIGDIENILKKLKGIELWFSIEKADEDRNKDFYLAPNGRYKHSLNYINKIKDGLESSEIQIVNLVLRKENGCDVEGFLIKIK